MTGISGDDVLIVLLALLALMFYVVCFACWLAGVKPSERKSAGYNMCKHGVEPSKSDGYWRISK